MRVSPDISMDADPSTGFLIGLHQTFPNGKARYSRDPLRRDQSRLTALAGVIADADQAAIDAGGAAIGFINPAIYRLVTRSGAITDIVPGGKQGQYRVDHASTYLGPGVKGSIDSFRQLTYEGPIMLLRRDRQLCHAGQHAEHGHGLRQHDRGRCAWAQLHQQPVRHLTDRGAEPPDSAWRQAGTRGCPPGALVVFLDRNMLG